MSDFNPSRARPVAEEDDELLSVIGELEHRARTLKDQNKQVIAEAAKEFRVVMARALDESLGEVEEAIEEMTECMKEMETKMAEEGKKSSHFDALKSSLGRVVKVQRETADAVGSIADAVRGVGKTMEGMETRHAHHMAEMQAMLKQMMEHKPEPAMVPMAMPAPKAKKQFRFTIERDDYGKAKYVHAVET